MPAPKSNFTAHLLALNNLTDSFQGWHFSAGMQFGDRDKWWGDKGGRGSAHEGLDLLYYVDRQGKPAELAPRTLLPALYDGEIVNIFPDFIGSSILLRHSGRNIADHCLYSIMGHTCPLPGIKPGARVSAAQPVATMAASKKPESLPAHLHISLLWLAPQVTAEELDWRLVNTSPGIILIDPGQILD